ncbi:MAG: hypothetical protein ACTHL8_22760 [Burkholderiaceae bacterium]
MTLDEAIVLFVDLATARPRAGQEELVAALRARGVEDAGRMMALVPMAFAHVVLARAGARLPDDFLICDAGRELTARRRLVDEPIFVAARTLARVMLADDDMRRRAARHVATLSAEWSTAVDLAGAEAAARGDFSQVVLTETVVIGLPVDAAAGRAGGWRALWARLRRR